MSESELEEILTSNSYNTKGTLSNELSILDRTLTSNNGKYQIPVSEIYKGSLTTANSGETPKGPNGKPLVNKTNIPETSHDKIIGEDANGNQVVVPDGFKVADDSGTTVKDGIVIEDSEGNQYVWVPVSNINHDGSNKIKVNSSSEEGVEIALGRYTFDTSSPGTPTLKQKASDYSATPDKAHLNTVYKINSYYYELSTHQDSNFSSGNDGTNTTAKDLAGFINSVNSNKGYYIARYEASYRVSEKVASKISTSTRTSSSTALTSGMLWNCIKQGDAAIACQNLYDSINSDLMNSYAWDTAIVYIQGMGNPNYANANRGSNTTLLNTGETGDQKCKIFDIAGNEKEWTTEYSTYKTSSATPCVERGGYYEYGSYCSGGRSSSTASRDYGDISFRSILYL